jgi:hypothetical protein
MRKTGWKPLPGKMKFVYVITLISIISGAIGFPFTVMNPSLMFFGFMLKGIITIFLNLFMLVVNAVFFYSIHKRKKWAWKLGTALHGFYLINALSFFFRSTPLTNEIIAMSGVPYTIAAFMKPVMIISMTLSVAFSTLILSFILLSKEYFEK